MNNSKPPVSKKQKSLTPVTDKKRGPPYRVTQEALQKAINDDYIFGEKTLREIADDLGISHVAVYYRARRMDGYKGTARERLRATALANLGIS